MKTVYVYYLCGKYETAQQTTSALHINRKELKKLMSEYSEKEMIKKCILDEYPLLQRDRLRRTLDDIPAADVRPVVRGTWVGIDDFPHEDWECDHCGCVVGNTDDPWNYYHFCPNCGADMRCCLGETYEPLHE